MDNLDKSKTFALPDSRKYIPVSLVEKNIEDLMADEILEQDISNQDDINHYDNKHEVMKYFEERCK